MDYLLFVSFFPQLVAGPIVSPKEMFPQFKKPFTPFQYSNIAIGVTLVIFGLFKKVVMADHLALYVTPVFQTAESGGSIDFFFAWQGAMAYTFQIYFDFSGYSDMAVGIARLFGIYLPINFYSPYKAKSIIDFWHRWHITLSRFLRNYLYFPLGGSRNGEIRRNVNLMLTMLLGGLWHGAGWTFIVWGGLHGAYLIANHGWRQIMQRNSRVLQDCSLMMQWCSCAVTMLFVIIAWVFFRADTFSGAFNIVQGLFAFDTICLARYISKDLVYVIMLFSCSAMIIWGLPNFYQVVDDDNFYGCLIMSVQKSIFKFKYSFFNSLVVACVLLICLICMVSDHGAGFIYNDF